MKIRNCPVCHGALQVRECYCSSCDLTLRGDFETSWLEALSEDQLDFVRLFVIVGGNIKEMEKRLKISYPTVKNRLALIVNRIKGSESVNLDFTDIMDDLEQGFITVDQALELIQTRREQ